MAQIVQVVGTSFETGGDIITDSFAWADSSRHLCQVRYDDHTFLVLILRLDDLKLPIESERTNLSASGSTASFCKYTGHVIVC